MSERWRIALLLAAVMLVYGNSLRNEFTHDDEFYIVDNPQVKQPSLRILEPHQGSNVYRPLTFATFALNRALGGLQPWSYHAVNVLLHAGVTWLLYLLLLAILGDSPRTKMVALAAAWLFAVHPIHTEAVTSIVGRAELLAAGFVFTAWLLHLRDREWPALLCFALAVFSKESAVVFPALAVIGDFARGQWKHPWRYARIAGVAAMYLTLLWQVQGGRFGAPLVAHIDNPLAALPVQWRVLNALHVAWKYVGLQVYPAVLSCDYSFDQIPVFLSWSKALPWLGMTLLAVAAWLWAGWRRNSALVLAGGIYLAGFSATANILAPTGTIMGERLAYLPSAGFCLLVALAWGWMLDRWKLVAAGVLAIGIAALSIRTVVRNRDWYDNFTLYSSAVAAVPRSAKMRNNLGGQYMWRKRPDLARKEYSAALAIWPDYPDALAAAGVLEFRSGDHRLALKMMDRALGMSRRDNPNFDFMAVNLAAVLLEGGYVDDSLRLLNVVIADSPAYSRAWSNRAVIYFKRGQLDAARADAATALRLDPANTQARSVLRMAGPAATANQ